jgi:hypothetical protein
LRQCLGIGHCDRAGENTRRAEGKTEAIDWGIYKVMVKYQTNSNNKKLKT